MASNSETNEMHSFIERLISSRNRDLSLFIPFILGFTTTDPGQTRPDPDPNSTDPDHNSANRSSPDGETRRDRIILINPLTQGMVVIEGTGLDALFRNLQGAKDGPPPASKSSIEAMPSVEIREGEEEGECVICLEDWVIGNVVKEMPCKHKFHGGCIEKWLKLHGSCPVCRFSMPVENDEGGTKGEEREEEGEDRVVAERDIWVTFAYGGRRRRTRTEEEEEEQSVDVVNQRDTEMEN